MKTNQKMIQKKWTGFGIGFGLLISILLLALLLRGGKGASPATGMQFEFDPNAVQYTGSLVSDNASGIQIPGYGSVYMQADTNLLELSLINPEENTCYFQYTLELANGEESLTLYESGLIEPGKAVKNLALSNTLSSGEYGLTIKISTFQKETYQEQNGAAINAILYVV